MSLTGLVINPGVTINAGVTLNGYSTSVSAPVITGDFTVGPYYGDQSSTQIDVSGYVTGTFTNLTIISVVQTQGAGGDGSAVSNGIYISFSATEPGSGEDVYDITYTVIGPGGTSNQGIVHVPVDNSA